LNGSLDRRAVLSGPMAFDPIHLHKYFHICIYFIHQVIACFSKYTARAIATLVVAVGLLLKHVAGRVRMMSWMHIDDVLGVVEVRWVYCQCWTLKGKALHHVSTSHIRMKNVRNVVGWVQ